MSVIRQAANCLLGRGGVVMRAGNILCAAQLIGSLAAGAQVHGAAPGELRLRRGHGGIAAGRRRRREREDGLGRHAADSGAPVRPQRRPVAHRNRRAAAGGLSDAPVQINDARLRSSITAEGRRAPWDMHFLPWRLEL